MQIIYIHKDRFAKRPPVISALLILSDLGYEVTLIDEEVSDYWQGQFRERQIAFVETHTQAKGNALVKLLSYYRFQKRVYMALSRIVKSPSDTIVWVEGAQTIVALGKRLNNFRHILQIQELHEKSTRQKKAIARVIHTAEAVFMPEYCRTLLYKVWYRLEKTPVPLPNKPYMLLEETKSNEILQRYEEQLAGIKGKHVILYQGGIKRIRLLDRVARAIKELGDNYHLLVVGAEQEQGVIAELKAITTEVTHIDFIPAPDYLAFCSIAHIGYVVYQPNSLNNIFCAPNKIFEYAAFGLPVIGNDIPGLKFPIEQNKAGVIVSPDDIESIAEGIRQIEADYASYSEGARNLFLSIDNKRTIQKTLEKL